MRSLLIAGAALAASLALAACGGSSSSENTASSAGSSSGGGGKTVAVKSVGGIGKVLVDSSGMALYASNVEAGGMVRCMGGCTSFWKPLTLDSGKPTAASGVGKLGVVKRPDGARQVTAGGKLLYTFAEDSPGNVKGNGFTDDFNGQHFVWNAVLASGKKATGSGSAKSSGSGGGSSSSGQGSYQYNPGGY